MWWLGESCGLARGVRQGATGGVREESPAASPPGRSRRRRGGSGRRGGRRGLDGLFLGVDQAGQLRLLAGRQVGVDDALGGGLIELLGREVVLRAQVLEGAGPGAARAPAR